MPVKPSSEAVTRMQAADDQPARAEAVGEAAGDRRDRDDHQGRGQEPDPGLQRRVVEDVLHVEGEEEEDAHHREGDDQGDDHGAEEVAVGEEANSTIGALTRSSIATKATSAERPRRPAGATISVEPQPQLLPSTRARTSAVSAGGQRRHAGVVDLAADGRVARLAHREERRPRRRRSRPGC